MTEGGADQGSQARLGILLISGEAGRQHYAFVVATGAAAIGREVVLFATNEGCRALLAELPSDSMPSGVAGLAELREAALAMGVRIIACETGLLVAGIKAPLADGVEIAGIVTFLEATRSAQVMTL